MPAGITETGGRFQQIQGVNEQHDFSKGLKTMTATDTADSPLSRMAGERFCPSQVCARGNSRKSSETESDSIGTFMAGDVIKGSLHGISLWRSRLPRIQGSAVFALRKE
jgi:hypothetical protein